MSTVAQMGNGNMAMVTNLTKDRFTLNNIDGLFQAKQSHQY
jgi:hypothetical protein